MYKVRYCFLKLGNACDEEWQAGLLFLHSMVLGLCLLKQELEYNTLFLNIFILLNSQIVGRPAYYKEVVVF